MNRWCSLTHTCMVTGISENVKQQNLIIIMCLKRIVGDSIFSPSCSPAFNTWTCMYTWVLVLFFVCVCVYFFYFWPKSFFSTTFTSSRWATHPDSLTCSFQIAPWKLPSSGCNYWRCWILFIRIIFTCVEDSGFPEVHHTAQFSWSSSPCTVVLGERELPWTAQPWRDGHGDCQQQVSVLSSLTLTCHGDCQQQVSVLSSETVTLKRCSRRLASRWVFVLSSVILNNHGD